MAKRSGETEIDAEMLAELLKKLYKERRRTSEH